ncbi:MAG: DUF992 domain-containing protein [Salaquimonas sp.]
MKRGTQLALLFAGFIGMATSANAITAEKKIGTLECFIARGEGMLVGSRKDVSCTLISNEGEPLENYIGELSKVGLDVGFTKENVLKWSVYVPEFQSYNPGELSGTFKGLSASASFAYGLGASVLIGGVKENFALQPLKISRQKGVNIAIGITQMELRYIEDTEEDPEPENEAVQEE